MHSFSQKAPSAASQNTPAQSILLLPTVATAACFLQDNTTRRRTAGGNHHLIIPKCISMALPYTPPTLLACLTLSPEVCVDWPAGDARDIGTPQLSICLGEWLLQLAIAGVNLGVPDEASEQVDPVHSRVPRQRLGQLNNIFDLHKWSTGGWARHWSSFLGVGYTPLYLIARQHGAFGGIYRRTRCYNMLAAQGSSCSH